ncbi:putative serine esterase-domain-containing protein [Schizophyllum commune]
MAATHLLVLVHGMWGNPIHLSELHRIIQEVKSEPSEDGTRLEVLLANTNSEEHTYDGIDWGGERVAQEIAKRIEDLEAKGDHVTKFSITGYSLGGLISRYVIGILHQQGFFEKITPVNFNTVATPHLGLLRYDSFWSSLSHSLGPRLLSRTGEQFYFVDKWSAKGRPLLEVMADPERVFYQALQTFKHIRIYGNAINDLTVPYLTACIELEDPFADYENTGLTVEYDDKYSPLIRSWDLPAEPPAREPKPKPLTVAWIKQFRLPRIPLPPRLSQFPYNVIFYVSFPVIVPLFFSLVLMRLTMSAHKSRRRIKLLEADPSKISSGETLMQVVARLEKDVEDAVADMMENPEGEESDASPEVSQDGLVVDNEAYPAQASDDTLAQANGVLLDKESGQPQKRKWCSHKRSKSSTHTKSSTPKSAPRIAPLQRKMAANLNALPIQKERAFIENVRNSHAVIISRDVKNFEWHRRGEGVIRHWADSFEL